MILLDTNVISEMMKPDGSSHAFAWLSGQSREELHTTTITQAEILAGLAILPPGRRRRDLQGSADQMFSLDFCDRVLGFDSMAAGHYAEIIALRRAAGRPVGILDAMIAAIARAHGASVATRNIGDFEGCGVALHDPWRGEAVPG